ncbi:YraN family protein [Saccharopolyspora sp. CA-218241]|uniref:YraN family protein n=1 Tax=Saccharopolyspora sp. CA-218241 TaxID=3240027 RepID=UPI003D98779E
MGSLSDDDTRGRRHALGVESEKLAARMLEQTGLTVLERNWRCPRGELDIVATDGDVVVFCEVKARAGNDYGGPLAAMTPLKITRVRELARTWLHERGLTGRPVRFDVVAILWPLHQRPSARHLPGVF